jgi:hypothetical protein
VNIFKEKNIKVKHSIREQRNRIKGEINERGKRESLLYKNIELSISKFRQNIELL